MLLQKFSSLFGSIKLSISRSERSVDYPVANDIVHWQTMITTNDLDLLAKKLRDAHVRFISPGVIVMPKDKTGFSKGALVSDLDGYCVLLIEK